MRKQIGATVLAMAMACSLMAGCSSGSGDTTAAAAAADAADGVRSTGATDEQRAVAAPERRTAVEQGVLFADAGPSVAKKEGYEQIAAIFQKTADNEKEPAKLWFKALGELPLAPTNGTQGSCPGC